MADPRIYTMPSPPHRSDHGFPDRLDASISEGSISLWWGQIRPLEKKMTLRGTNTLSRIIPQFVNRPFCESHRRLSIHNGFEGGSGRSL